MSLVRKIEAMVTQRGSATVDDLLPSLAGYTRKQVMDGFQNCRDMGLIHCTVIQRRRKGTIPPTHFPGPKPRASVFPERQIEVRPPNSAWELAHGRQIAGTWPPSFHAARRHSPLGDWNEVDATEPGRPA